MGQHTEQDLLDAQVRKLRLEADKLDRELERLSRPLWRHPAFWRSVLAAAATVFELRPTKTDPEDIWFFRLDPRPEGAG